MGIERILTPLKYDNFMSDYWESQPLHIDRTNVEHFANLLSEKLIIALVEEAAVSFPDVQAINANKSVPVADYTLDDKSVCPVEMMRVYAEGATIVVSEVHKKFSSVQTLCSAFNKEFQARCQANAYLSPPGNQGFHSHYDTHDVFVLQIAGRKKFRFYASEIELPFTEDDYRPENNTSSDLIDEVELSAGDTLYIPRGIVHDAIADEGEPSLHITLGVFPFVLRDLMQEMVQVAAERNVQLRSSVDLNPAATTASELYHQAAGVFQDDIYSEALSRFADELALENSMQVKMVEAPVVSLLSRIVVQRSVVFGTEEHDGRFKLRLSGQVLCFTNPLSTAVDNILGSDSMLVKDVPGLDDEQKVALCRQLAEAGAITVTNVA